MVLGSRVPNSAVFLLKIGGILGFQNKCQKIVCTFIPTAFALMLIPTPSGCQARSNIVMGHGKYRETTLAGKWGLSVVRKPPNSLLAYIAFGFGVIEMPPPNQPAKVVSRVFLCHICIRRPEKQSAGSSSWNWPNGSVGSNISFFEHLRLFEMRMYFIRRYGPISKKFGTLSDLKLPCHHFVCWWQSRKSSS